MSRSRQTNRRCWQAASEFYAALLRQCDALLRVERDPAALLAGTKIRDDLREAMRAAVRHMHQVPARSVQGVGSLKPAQPVAMGHGWPAFDPSGRTRAGEPSGGAMARPADPAFSDPPGQLLPAVGDFNHAQTQTGGHSCA